MITQDRHKDFYDQRNLSKMVTYSSDELEKYRKDDWKESKKIVQKLYPRSGGNKNDRSN